MSDVPPPPFGAPEPPPSEGQDQPPPGRYQPPGQYQPPEQYQPAPPYQPPPGGYTPPPPPGGYTPPPPGGYGPPPPPGGYGARSGGGFGSAPSWSAQAGAPLAEWPQRALGWLIDWGIGVGLFVAAVILGAILGTVSNALFVLVRVIGSLAALAWSVWVAVQVGQTGQSPGMRVTGLKAIRKDTGGPLGVAMGIVRWLVHVVLSFLCVLPVIVDYLFPLWDREKQTLADKVVNAVVIVVPKQRFSLQPPPQQTY